MGGDCAVVRNANRTDNHLSQSPSPVSSKTEHRRTCHGRCRPQKSNTLSHGTLTFSGHMMPRIDSYRKETLSRCLSPLQEITYRDKERTYISKHLIQRAIQFFPGPPTIYTPGRRSPINVRWNGEHELSCRQFAL